MKIEEYIEIAKTLTHSRISESTTNRIIEEYAKDKRTELMEEGKTKRTETFERKNEDDMATEKQRYFLGKEGYEGNLNELTKKEASKLIAKYKKNKSFY